MPNVIGAQWHRAVDSHQLLNSGYYRIFETSSQTLTTDDWLLVTFTPDHLFSRQGVCPPEGLFFPTGYQGQLHLPVHVYGVLSYWAKLPVNQAWAFSSSLILSQRTTYQAADKWCVRECNLARISLWASGPFSHATYWHLGTWFFPKSYTSLPWWWSALGMLSFTTWCAWWHAVPGEWLRGMVTFKSSRKPKHVSQKNKSINRSCSSWSKS